MADLINNPIIIKKAYDHLSNDPVLKYLIEKFGDKIDLLIDGGIIKNNPSKIFMFEADEIKQIR